MNDNNFLSFDLEKVQAISLSQLERTHKENDVYGNPLKGIYHYQLLNQVLEMCHQHGYSTDVYDMFAAQNKDRQSPGVVLLPQVENQYGKNAVEAHILRRVYANIRLTDFDDDEMTTNIAVAFHQKGVQVGFGNMVKICHNQCMLGADRYIATYGDKGEGRGAGSSLAEIMETIGGWLTNARHMVINDRERIARMRATDVPAERTFQLIGMLTAQRVKCDTSHKEIRDNVTYPLNQTQINKYTELLLLKYHKHSRVSLWDIYDCATQLYKATDMDIPEMLPQNRAMVSFLESQFEF